jgi:hypothetical protein
MPIKTQQIIMWGIVGFETIYPHCLTLDEKEARSHARWFKKVFKSPYRVVRVVLTWKSKT